MTPSRRMILGSAAALTAAVATGCQRGVKQPAEVATLTIKKSDIPVGQAVIFTEGYVVSQPVEGEFHAYSNICTHQHCPIGRIIDGVAECSCHGSRFDPTDGSVVQGPATVGLTEALITDQGEELKLQL